MDTSKLPSRSGKDKFFIFKTRDCLIRKLAGSFMLVLKGAVRFRH